MNFSTKQNLSGKITDTSQMGCWQITWRKCILLDIKILRQNRAVQLIEIQFWFPPPMIMNIQ